MGSIEIFDFVIDRVFMVLCFNCERLVIMTIYEDEICGMIYGCLFSSRVPSYPPRQYCEFKIRGEW